MWTKSYGQNHTKFCAFWQQQQKKKRLIIFDKELTPIWKVLSLWLKKKIDDKILIQKTITFQCSKIYGTPTRETMLKVAPTWQTRSVSTPYLLIFWRLWCHCDVAWKLSVLIMVDIDKGEQNIIGPSFYGKFRGVATDMLQKITNKQIKNLGKRVNAY